MWVVPGLLAVAGAAVAVTWLNAGVWMGRLYGAERRAKGREFEPSVEEVACLAGHLVELRLLAMYDAGRIVVSRSGDVTATAAAATTSTDPEDYFEAAAVRTLGPTRTGDMRTLTMWLDDDAPPHAVRRRLVAAGLLNDAKLLDRASLAEESMALVSFVVAAVGVAAFVYALVRGENWLLPLLAFPALFAVARLAIVLVDMYGDFGRHTGLGSRVLSEARSADRREHGPTVDRHEHAPMAVALAGMSALPAGHALRICLEASRARASARARGGRSTHRSHGGGGYSGRSCGGNGPIGCGTSCGSNCGS
ncbi:TIGR04222 domain-containing membrane protein [Kitasatospora sp. NPDC056783]|uniref:TIGR04222 domain-containing membrane protein n=1 Tax=Kitasatospora sp. NPDC056783 TaxID=3345943 RepID=UPI0036A2EB77